eukprot:7710934-Pyramimonas_sp.AAC.2
MSSRYKGPNRERYVTRYTNGVNRAMADAAGTPATAPPGNARKDKPKPPTLTPCDIFGPHVDTFLKSVQLYLYNFTLLDAESAMVYANNLTETSKSHLYNIHPLTDLAFYSSSTNVIAFLEQFTNKTEKVIHSFSKLRSLTMKGLKLKANHRTFTKLLADIGWDYASIEVVRFFVEGLNLDALPSNLKLIVQDCASYPGVTVMQLYCYADRKLALAHGENYQNLSVASSNKSPNQMFFPTVLTDRIFHTLSI